MTPLERAYLEVLQTRFPGRLVTLRPHKRSEGNPDPTSRKVVGPVATGDEQRPLLDGVRAA